MSIAGIHVSAGRLFVAIVDLDDELPSGVRGRSDPIAPFGVDATSELSAGLANVFDRISQDIRSFGVVGVGVLETRLFSNWKYSEAFNRVSLVGVALTAAAKLDVPARMVKTETAARAAGGQAAKLSELDPAQFGFNSRPVNWTTGLAAAHGAASGFASELK